MSGIYVHIPFCRSKCFYCGFYSVASLRLKKQYLQALCREMQFRQDYLAEKVVSSVYFGGGTPSFLDERDLEIVVDNIHKYWTFTDDAEWSIELNPEDAQPSKLAALRRLGFNRLTIGVQSFNDAILKRINRTHSAEQALLSVEMAKKSGFDNVGIDLIIGLPGSSILDLEKELNIVKSMEINHVSVYILSIDSNTVFEKLSEKGLLELQDDDSLAEQYLFVSDFLKRVGYEHYEISNFAKNYKYSRHNTSCWQQKPYIGLGAAAHSYDGKSRQWNISNIKSYIESLDKGVLSFDKENLKSEDRYNEYLMTNFRTMWGIDTDYLAKEFPDWWRGTQERLQDYQKRGLIQTMGSRMRMTERCWLLSDGIFSELFV